MKIIMTNETIGTKLLSGEAITSSSGKSFTLGPNDVVAVPVEDKKLYRHTMQMYLIEGQEYSATIYFNFVSDKESYNEDELKEYITQSTPYNRYPVSGYVVNEYYRNYDVACGLWWDSSSSVWQVKYIAYTTGTGELITQNFSEVDDMFDTAVEL